MPDTEQNENNPENKPYRIIDHTADIGIEADGDSLEQAFEHVALGMFETISDGSEVEILTTVSVKAEAEDLEELLVNYLTELLYLYDVEGVLFGEFEVEIFELGGSYELEGEARGEMFIVGKHNYPIEIKAVTYHMLEVKETPPYVRVIFDL
jgi:SHS2 domain-containing protein